MTFEKPQSAGKRSADGAPTAVLLIAKAANEAPVVTTTELPPIMLDVVPEQ